jgi:hypothetical protein
MRGRSCASPCPILCLIFVDRFVPEPSPALRAPSPGGRGVWDSSLPLRRSNASWPSAQTEIRTPELRCVSGIVSNMFGLVSNMCEDRGQQKKCVWRSIVSEKLPLRRVNGEKLRCMTVGGSVLTESRFSANRLIPAHRHESAFFRLVVRGPTRCRERPARWRGCC